MRCGGLCLDAVPLRQAPRAAMVAGRAARNAVSFDRDPCPYQITQAPRQQGKQAWPTLGRSVWLACEDECRAGNDRRAGADERHVDILDLTRTGATGGLQGALDDVPQAMNAARAQAAAKRVQWQLAVKRDPAALDEVEGFALSAEAVGL